MANNVGSVNGPGATPSYYKTLYSKKTEKGSANLNFNPVDKYTAGKKPTHGVYSKDSITADKPLNKANASYMHLRSLVEHMLGTGKTGGQGYWAMLSDAEEYGLNIDEQMQADAEQMIGEDGYYGVKQTTQRIMDFAKALGGDNASEETIENLRKGVQDGFNEVAKLFGGFDKLPEVTKQTYEAVMKEFDAWKAGSAPTE